MASAVFVRSDGRVALLEVVVAGARLGALHGFFALLDHHVGVEGLLGELEPQVVIAAHREHRLVHLLERRVLGRDLVQHLVRRGKAGIENGFGKRTRLGATENQPLQGRRVLDVVARRHRGVGERRGRLDGGLVGFRQRVPLLQIEEEVAKGAYAFSKLYKNATERYFETEGKYGLTLNPFRILDLHARGYYMGALGNLVMIEYGIRQLKK